ncbi:MAG: hypothetical protein KDK70_19035 [Myxococcales bacterium]|nr:hypothetical protein [Myxococcales bacterium]
MPVELKIRDIRTGQAQVAELPDLDQAEAWLRERPQFIQIMGPVHEGAMTRGEEARLKQAMRPFDEEELEVMKEQDRRDAEAMARIMAREQEAARRQVEAQREANRNADPNRPMKVTWEKGDGCRNGDETDDRAVPQVVVDAIDEWVAERNTWVHSRNQYLINAQVVAWPGPVPEGHDRIQPGGQFNVISGTPETKPKSELN